MLLARRFTLNPLLIILSLVFWFGMWGMLAAILAIMMLAILKIISEDCARSRPWSTSLRGVAVSLLARLCVPSLRWVTLRPTFR
jgi:predicted PurR-regulated permease PerM